MQPSRTCGKGKKKQRWPSITTYNKRHKRSNNEIFLHLHFKLESNVDREKTVCELVCDVEDGNFESSTQG